jgi:hypothetical protein
MPSTSTASYCLSQLRKVRKHQEPPCCHLKTGLAGARRLWTQDSAFSRGPVRCEIWPLWAKKPKWLSSTYIESINTQEQLQPPPPAPRYPAQRRPCVPSSSNRHLHPTRHLTNAATIARLASCLYSSPDVEEWLNLPPKSERHYLSPHS